MWKNQKTNQNFIFIVNNINEIKIDTELILLIVEPNQTFILFTYGEMWLLNKISCEIQILNEKVGKLMIENGKLEEENKKLKSDLAFERNMLDNVRAEYDSLQNVIGKLKETIKDHQLYEEKLEHRIIEFEELLHGE